MKLWELFYSLKNKKEWNETGDKVNWDISSIKEGKNKYKIFLMFQDSNGFRDWINNLRYFLSIYTKKSYKNQKSKTLVLHSGFINAYKSANDFIMCCVLDKIASIKKENENTKIEVIITGWSHGGGLSQLAAEDLNFKTRKDINNVESGIKPKVVIFGSPKVLVFNDTANYVRSCCSEIIEVSQNNDLITKLPPLLRYKHISKDIKRVGTKLNIFKLLNPWKYHTSYDDENIYKNHEYYNIDI